MQQVTQSVRSAADELIAQGNALEDQGRPSEALIAYKKALGLAPDYPKVHINVGNALLATGHVEAAQLAFARAVQIDPAHARARFNLATTHMRREEWAKAEAELRQVLVFEPSLDEASVMLSLILEHAGRFAEAEAQLRKVLERRPDHAGAALNLGTMLLAQHRFDEAVKCMMIAKAIAPDALSFLLFRLNDRPELDRGELFRRHLIVGEAIRSLAGPAFTTWENSQDVMRRLRVGYVSSDFNWHPIGMLMKPILSRHDPEAFEVHCFSGTSNPDEITRLYEQTALHWHDISRLSPDSVSSMVRELKIDILVDLAGHTNNNWLPMFARHPAPVQVTWMGYLNTTGLSAMDYRICDRHTDPAPDADRYCTERLVRMPNSQWVYEPWWAPVGPVPNRANGQIRFGSVNRYAKISDTCIDLWTRAARRVPESTLVLVGVPHAEHAALLGRLVARGLDAKRVDILPRVTLAEYYNLIASFDIALDAFPYSGGTTTLDALWMGTPMITLSGDRAASRSASSILRTLGLDAFVTNSPDEYVALNVRLAQDVEVRAMLRASLRERMGRSPLMDAAGFVEALERSYREMWRSWCIHNATA